MRHNNECLYLDSRGNKCAVGCLIPEDEYNTVFEGKGISRLLDNHGGHLSRQTASMFYENWPLLGRLQYVHDTAENWRSFETLKAALEETALIFNLSSSALTSIPPRQTSAYPQG